MAPHPARLVRAEILTLTDKGIHRLSRRASNLKYTSGCNYIGLYLHAVDNIQADLLIVCKLSNV